MDYLKFFNLDEDPFRITPDPAFFFPSDRHNELLLSMNYLIEQKEGFLLVTGEPGTGKTTTLKVFIDRWRENTEIALIMTPRLSPEEFLLAVLEDLKITVPATNKHEVLKAFRNFLVSSAEAGKRTVIIVDEAQNLPDETLEELRLLSNLETEKEKLLQIVLIGQPELKMRLRQQHLTQLNQRITIRISLDRLTQQETTEYVNYRLTRAGKATVTFGSDASKRLHKLSGGIPRLINLIASRALMAAFVEGKGIVRENHVNHAAAHVLDTGNARRPFNFRWAAAAIGTAGILAVLALAFK